tara:strand:- start:2871 stop:3068 length:198 start_codon:yes stop_codon:yes gene_type:complete
MNLKKNNMKDLGINNGKLRSLNSKELVLIKGGSDLTDTIWYWIGYGLAKWGQGNVAYQRGIQGEY